MRNVVNNAAAYKQHLFGESRVRMESVDDAACSVLSTRDAVLGTRYRFSWSSMDVHGEDEEGGGMGNGKRASVLTGREAGQPCSHAPMPPLHPSSIPNPIFIPPQLPSTALPVPVGR